MASPCFDCDIFMGCFWYLHGRILVSRWVDCYISMALIVACQQVDCASPLVDCVISMGCFWYIHGRVVVSPEVDCDISIG